jgi:hypothetical protein
MKIENKFFFYLDNHEMTIYCEYEFKKKKI